MGQPLPMAWKDAAKDPHACSIGAFFDRQGVHDTAFGRRTSASTRSWTCMTLSLRAGKLERTNSGKSWSGHWLIRFAFSL